MVKIVRQGIQLHGTQLRRYQQRYQAKPARPSHDIGQPPRLLPTARKALQIKCACQTDERGGAHPVSCGGHAVVHGRDAPPCHVVLVFVAGAARNANQGINHDRAEQEDGAYQIAGKTPPFSPSHGPDQGAQKRDVNEHIAM